jgi:aldehyde:ferredoxin oxidoreductase
MMDTVELCQFVWGPAWTLYGPAETVEMVRAVTGWDVTLEELLRVGQRRLNMLRAFNAREGMGRAQDQLPKKFFRPLQGTGPTAGIALSQAEIEAALDEYYRLAGWTTDGIPTPETLAALGLEWVTL